MSTVSQVESRDALRYKVAGTVSVRVLFSRLGMLVLAVVAAYASTPFNFWVGDDYNYIVPKSIGHVISFFDPTVPSRAFYRPLNWTSWSIDYALWGASPFGWHISSILFHAITTVVVSLIAYRLLNDWWPALLAGALFALQPAHTETVSWIGGRADLVSGLFYFPAVLFFVMYMQGRPTTDDRRQTTDDRRPTTDDRRPNDDRTRNDGDGLRPSPIESANRPSFFVHRPSSRLLYFLALLMALCALLGKEIGVTVPVALLLTDLFLFPPERSRLRDLRYWLQRLVPHIPFFAIVAAYAAMRYYLVAAHIVTNVYGGPSLLDPRSLLDATARNITLILGLPSDPNFIPDMPGVIKVGIVLFGLALAVLIARWLGRWAIYSLLWLCLTLLPTANLSQLRWLYMPSFGVCLIGALVAWRLVGGRSRVAQEQRAWPLRNVGYLFIAVLLFLWGLGTIYQNLVWYQSGQVARSVLDQIQADVPKTTEPVTIYFAGAPNYYKSVFLFNTGLAASMAYLYPGRDISLHEIEQPLPDPVVRQALSNPPKLGPNPVYLGYQNGVVTSYPSIQALARAGLKKE